MVSLIAAGASPRKRLKMHGPAGAAAPTLVSRFAEMRSTLALRVTCGKSAIHGLGAFAKVCT